jgi:hypothetical protein
LLQKKKRKVYISYNVKTGCHAPQKNQRLPSSHQYFHRHTINGTKAAKEAWLSAVA